MIRIELKPHVAQMAVQHPVTKAVIGMKDLEFNQKIILVRTTTAEGVEQPPFEFGYVGTRPGEPINQIAFRGISKAAIDVIAEEVAKHVNEVMVKPGEQARKMFRFTPMEFEDAEENDTDIIEDDDE